MKTLKFILIILTLTLVSWKPQNKTRYETMSPLQGRITLNYTKLILTKDQYNFLTKTGRHSQGNGVDKRDIIIFQFAYLDAVYPYPTLKAYYQQVDGSKNTFKNSVDLKYLFSRPAPDLSVCDPHVTGDLKISYDEMEEIKKLANPKDPENYTHFVFTPVFDANIHYVYYQITVEPTTDPGISVNSKSINPSPPYGGSL